MASQRLDHKVLALDTALSITSAVVSSALGASWLGSLILAALAPALLTFVHHPGAHKRRRTAVGLALYALLHLLQALLARVRGRPTRSRVPGWGHAVRFGELTAALAFAITVVTLTAPELVLGDALVSDRSLTLFPARETETCPIAKRTRTDRETGITTVKPKDRKPPGRPVPTPDRPHPRSLDPIGPPPTGTTPPASPTPTPEPPEEASEPKSPRIPKSPPPQPETSPQPRSEKSQQQTEKSQPQTEETPQPQTQTTPEPQPEESPQAEERLEPPPAEQPPARRPRPRPTRPEPDPDITAPVFTGSREIVVTTLRRPRTSIPYPVPPAKDDRDPQPVVTCDPSSVEAGTTAKVSCTARDSVGNSNEQPFYVTIRIGDG